MDKHQNLDFTALVTWLLEGEKEGYRGTVQPFEMYAETCRKEAEEVQASVTKRLLHAAELLTAHFQRRKEV